MLLLLGVLAGFDTLLNGEYAFSFVWFCFSFLVATALTNSRYFKKSPSKLLLWLRIMHIQGAVSFWLAKAIYMLNYH